MSTPGDDTTSGRRLDLGQAVHVSDGAVGEVIDVVIHPVLNVVTHLVVGPRRHHQEARLLPIDAVARTDDAALQTSLTAAEYEQLPRVEERDFFRMADWPQPTEEWDIGITEVLALPYHAGDFGPAPTVASPALLGYDRIPAGEVEIRRLSPVVDRDGAPAGHVESFIVDPEDHITHLVIDRGHLWTHREVTVPIGAATAVRTDEVQLELTADEVTDLPTVRYHRHH